MNIIPMSLPELRFMRDAYLDRLVNNASAASEAFTPNSVEALSKYGDLMSVAAVLMKVDSESSIQYDHSYDLTHLFGTEGSKNFLEVEVPFSHSNELIEEFKTEAVGKIQLLTEKNSQTFIFVSESFVHGRHAYLLSLFETLKKLDHPKVKVVMDERLYKEYLEFRIHNYINQNFKFGTRFASSLKSNNLGVKFVNDFEDGQQSEDSTMFDPETAFFPDSVFEDSIDPPTITQDLINKCNGRFTFSPKQLSTFKIPYLLQRIVMLKAYYAQRYTVEQDPNIQPNLLIVNSSLLGQLIGELRLPMDKRIFTEDYFKV
jgi:hypothetical protein